MSEEREDMPDTDELEEPSTEKNPGEEPKAPAPHDPAPDHEAVGIGIVGGEGVIYSEQPEAGDA
jgi:hypothetical protein